MLRYIGAICQKPGERVYKTCMDHQCGADSEQSMNSGGCRVQGVTGPEDWMLNHQLFL